MTWTVEIVKARFFEAADVERRTIFKRNGGGGNAWPSYRFDEEDRAGWDATARLDELEKWQMMKGTLKPEQTRYEEVLFQWKPMIRADRWALIWNWSRCIALEHSFSNYCRDHNLNRATAYNRLDRAFELLTFRLRNDAILLQLADDKWARQFEGRHVSILTKVDEVDANRGPTIHPPFRTEAHRDMLGTTEAVNEFTKHLSATNEARRRARLRKALRGVPSEHEAA